MKISQTYRAALIATHTIDSTPQKPKSALRGLMQRLGLAFLACTLVIAATGSASAGEAQDEAAVRALGDSFAKAFVQKNAEAPSIPIRRKWNLRDAAGRLSARAGRNGEGLRSGGAAAVNGTTQAAFSNYRVRFIKPDVAVVDALLTVHNVNGPDGTIIPVIPVNFFYVAVRHGDQWLIEDGRAHFAPAPPNGMTAQN